MSYSMSPPLQKPAPRPYSPAYPQSSTSPSNAGPYGPPPAKRQRMSPSSPPNGAASGGWQPPPNGLPSASPTGYGNPYAQPVQPPYAQSPNYAPSPGANSFNTPQPYQHHYYQTSSPWQSQPATPAPQQQQQQRQMSPADRSREMMPPPAKPYEEKVGPEEMDDVLRGSGINIKDEENYIYNLYNNRHSNAQEPGTQSFNSSSGNYQQSFGSSTLSPGTSFNNLTQGTSFGPSQEAFAGTLGQTQTEEDIEVEHRRKREAAARDQAERQQHHLNNQFLQCNNVRKRMDRIARDFHVTLNMMGVFIRQPDNTSTSQQTQAQPQTSVLVNGAGDEGMVATKEASASAANARPESVVNQNMPFEQIVSLVSLAAGERIRGLVDEAGGLARARRLGDRGRVVPVDFAGLAGGVGERAEKEIVRAESVTGTSWDKVDGEGADGEVRESRTVSFAGNLNSALRDIAARDKQAEKDRVARREARKRKALQDPSSSTPPADAITATEAPAENVPAEQPKLTKKQQAKQAAEQKSSSHTEAQLHNTTNQTAAMMALGKKGRRYDWMTGAAANVPTNRFAKTGASTTGSGTATPTAKAAETPVLDGGQLAEGPNVAPEAQWGDWREEKRGGIEMRDWVLVLERDGRERKGLVRALMGGKLQ